MLVLISFSFDLDWDDLKMVMLLGRFSFRNEYFISYWIMDKVGCDCILL